MHPKRSCCWCYGCHPSHGTTLAGDGQHRLQALEHDGVQQDLAEPGAQGDVQQVQPQGRDLLPAVQRLHRLEVLHGVANDEGSGTLDRKSAMGVLGGDLLSSPTERGHENEEIELISSL